MARNTLNFVLDLVLAVLMLGLAATGLIMWWVLPPGTGHTHSLWGLGRHEFGEVHFVVAVAIMLGLVLHLALHWQWVCGMARRLLLGSKSVGHRGALAMSSAWELWLCW